MKTHSALYLLRSLQIVALLLFLACSKSDDSDPDPFPSSNAPKGAYTGSWTSLTSTGASFKDYPVYAIFDFNSDHTQVNGEFFVSPKTYNSSVNDGTITMRLDGNTVTSFLLNDTLLDCEGTFNGTGQVSGDGTFVISFTGTDCDGDHVGEMVFSKVE